MTDRESLPLYRRGQWSDAPSPLSAPSDDLDQALPAVGYAPEYTRFGAPAQEDGGGPALRVFARTRVPTVGERSGDAEYLLVVVIGGVARMVLAGDVVDVMDLLRKWVPTVQGWTVIDMLRQIDGVEVPNFTQDDLVALVAARAAHGASQVDVWRPR